MLKFYWYAGCSTCKKAKKALDDAGVAYKTIDITETPPSKSDIAKWIKAGHIELKQLFNSSGQEYRKLGGKELLTKHSEGELLEMLA